MSQSGGRSYPRRGDRVYRHSLLLDGVECTVELTVEWPTAAHPLRCRRVVVTAANGAGLNSRMLMHLPLRSLLLQVQQDEQLARRAIRTQQRLRAGPKGHPPEFYGEVAEQWVLASLTRPDPTQHVAGLYGVSPQAFRHWLGRARELGWLPPRDRERDYLQWVRAAGVLPYTTMLRGIREGIHYRRSPQPLRVREGPP